VILTLSLSPHYLSADQKTTDIGHQSSVSRPTLRHPVESSASEIPLKNRRLLLLALRDTKLTPEDFIEKILDFSQLPAREKNSEDLADFLLEAFKEAQRRGILTPELLRRLGYLLSGDSFESESPGFARLGRGQFEQVRDALPEAQKHDLDSGMRERFSEVLPHPVSQTPREAILKLMKGKNIWDDKKFSESADFLIGKPFIGSWDFAVKNLGVLFLLKAREVSPEAKRISDEAVKHWLEYLDKKGPQERESLHPSLSRVDNPDLLKQLENSARSPSNRHKNGVINSPTIIYGHQYRNLVLKEILRIYPLTPDQRKKLANQLAENEKELTEQLSLFELGETTTDEITGYNTFSLVTTILTAKDPSRALQVIREKSEAPFAPYRIYSDYKATPRAGAARTVPYRLAELAHEKDPEKQKVLKQKLAAAATNFMNYLPDLMFHSRGRYMHRGEDQLAPYFFHPAVPYEAAALTSLASDPQFSEIERKEFKEMRSLLTKALLASQKKDGTFATPDQIGDGDGAYSSSPIWVNPLTGLALLSLIDDTVEPQSQWGILNPDIFKTKP
jgi:hypothetical protein